MLEMQRLAPEMRRLQAEHRGDRQKLNEEMMKLYQEHKVNPMASCLPLVAQMPVFIIMFRILHGMTYEPAGGDQLVAQSVLDAGGDTRPIGFVPRYLSKGSDLYQSLVRNETMTSFGLDLSKSPAEMLGQDFAKGLIYAGLVVLLGLLYWVQQRMVASRAAVSPTMSPAQQKLMQYLPVVFAIFQVFFLAGLIIYYMAQAVLRIGQQAYITKRFYGHEESLGRQAQRAGDEARELAKQDGGGGLLGQPKATSKADSARPAKPGKPGQPTSRTTTSKRTTPPKGRPTPSGKTPTGPRTTSSSRPSGSKSSGKRRR
jgi:YidC/Oxa1 family membrane protein insertase